MTPPGPVRVVVADDSATARTLLVEVLGADPEVAVVGEAIDGAEAVRLIRRLRPSIAVMDIHMPVMDGLEATKRIMREMPTPIVVVTGSLAPHEVEVSLRAMRVGALTVLPKLPAPRSPGFPEAAARIVSVVKALAEVTVVRRHWFPGEPPGPPPPPALPGARIRLVALAASTGGPAAIFRLLEQLPAELAAPVVVAQHLAPGFLAGLVTWLGSGTELLVTEAADGEPLRAGTVYLPPDGHDLEVGPRARAVLVRRPDDAGLRPSADVLFASVARRYGQSAVGVVLTGMGVDGLEGARALKRAGGLVLAQDRASSVVFGMPGAVVAAGLADRVGSVDELAGELVGLVRRA
ncbi:MAG TPA: chemotaxis-specific protein-glutamate methyltransferase CheB [Verrucomicrobiae bacterium]|nr:chemotaxis-specific protein-glutamate methyltransferase CheB [Verrucomicrobiae bacterium]